MLCYGKLSIDEHVEWRFSNASAASGPLRKRGLFFMNNQRVLKMCIIALMSALSIILECFVKIDFGFGKLTIYALPLLVVGLSFGPLVGMLCGLVTGFVTQLYFWGFSVTMPIWMLAPMTWGLLSGLLFKIKTLHKPSILNIAIIIGITSLSVTLINTLATWLDGVILGYHASVIFVQVMTRIGISLVMSIFYTIAVYYILKALKPILKV